MNVSIYASVPCPLYRIDRVWYSAYDMKEMQVVNEPFVSMVVHTEVYNSKAVLVVNKRGMCTVTEVGGRLTVVDKTSDMVLRYPVEEMHEIVIPNKPDTEVCDDIHDLVYDLKKYGFTINEFLGKSKVKETISKVELDIILDMQDDELLENGEYTNYDHVEGYCVNNVIVVIHTTDGRDVASIASVTKNGDIEYPFIMLV